LNDPSYRTGSHLLFSHPLKKSISDSKREGFVCVFLEVIENERREAVRDVMSIVKRCQLRRCCYTPVTVSLSDVVVDG
jgi:hypothetical protein